ncbi:MAG TPA: ABC transporter permease [Caulobacteraceae bacterium]|jgi:ABC-2 type transport system permease protein|nr:ABC transporter permease [Caulobacteraceae bacterium]
MRDVIADVAPPAPREYRGANWEGLRTLYLREVRRFWKVGVQTLAAPVVTALLYMLVFVVAVRGARPPLEGIAFSAFVAPGLIMMQVLSNAFANSSSSLLQAKMNGLIGDFLTPPLTPSEQVAGFALGAATRGVAVGAVTALAVLPFTSLHVAHLWAVLYFGVGAALIMGLLGIMTAIWSVRFDHIAAVSNFVVMPMTFLSGTFYMASRLPEPFRTASHFNPFFYLIAGFRYGFIGHADGSVAVGVAVTAILTLGLTWVCHWMFASGYRLKT